MTIVNGYKTVTSGYNIVTCFANARRYNKSRIKKGLCDMTKRGIGTVLFSFLLLVGCMGCLRTMPTTATPSASDVAPISPISLQVISTSISAKDVNWYEQSYFFENGQAILQYSSEQGNDLFAIDRNGKLTAESYTSPAIDQPTPPKKGAVSARENLYFIPQNDEYALMNSEGEKLTEAIYTQIGQFYDGICVVTIKGQDHPVVINTGGEILGKLPEACTGRAIGCNMIAVQTKENQQPKQWIYHASGQLLTDRWFDTVGYVYNGLVPVTANQTLYVVDQQGKLVENVSLVYDAMTTVYGESQEKTQTYHPYIMNEDALIMPIKGQVAVVSIQRNQ